MASQLTVRDVLAGRAPQDASVTVKGWVRTRRDSKAGFSFVSVSDGSSFHPVQVVAPSTLPNYADEVLRLLDIEDLRDRRGPAPKPRALTPAPAPWRQSS